MFSAIEAVTGVFVCPKCKKGYIFHRGEEQDFERCCMVEGAFKAQTFWLSMNPPMDDDDEKE